MRYLFFLLFILFQFTPSSSNAQCAEYWDFPQKVGAESNPPSNSGDLVVHGSCAYVISDDGFDVLDMSDPTSYNRVLSIDAEVEGLAIDNNSLYVAVGASGVAIFDISIPLSPVYIESIPTRDFANDVDVDMGILAIAENTAGTRLFDISEPGVLLEVCHIPIGARDHSKVDLDNHRLLIQAADLFLYDIRIPAAPVQIRKWKTYYDSYLGEHYSRYYVNPVLHGDWLGVVNVSHSWRNHPIYGYSYHYSSVAFYDVSPLSNKKVVVGYGMGGSTNTRLGASDGRVFLAIKDFGQRYQPPIALQNSLMVFDLEADGCPLIQAMVLPDEANGLFVVNDEAYVSTEDVGVHAYSFPMGSSVNVTENPSGSHGYSYDSILVDNGKVFVTGTEFATERSMCNFDDLLVFDASDLANGPIASIPPSYYELNDMVMWNGRLLVGFQYALCPTDGGLGLIDVGTFEQQNDFHHIILDSSGDYNFNHLAVKDDVLFAVLTNGNLAVFDISNVYNPQEVIQFSNPTFYDIQVAGHHLYALSSSGIQTFDISDPLNPQSVSIINATGSWLEYSDNLLFAGGPDPENHRAGQMQMYSLEPGPIPDLLMDYHLEFPPAKVTANGGQAYVSFHKGGVSLLDLDQGTIIGTFATGKVTDHAVNGQELLVLTLGGLVSIPLDCSDPLPVFIQDFQVKTLQSQVTLSWEISDPSLNIPSYSDHFQILARTPNRNWVINSVSWENNRFFALDDFAEVQDGEEASYELQHWTSNSWTTVAEKSLELSIPRPQFRLIGGNPNPFNPKVTIGFSMDSAADVRLEVYDLLGRKVATITEGVYAAGDHSVDWVANDKQGRSLASGTYLLRLTSGQMVRTSKLMLAK